VSLEEELASDMMYEEVAVIIPVRFRVPRIAPRTRRRHHTQSNENIFMKTAGNSLVSEG
jgi:pyruvate/2-oxoglutarate/acetoin dehydrogenase E1 component